MVAADGSQEGGLPRAAAAGVDGGWRVRGHARDIQWHDDTTLRC